MKQFLFDQLAISNCENTSRKGHVLDGVTMLFDSRGFIPIQIVRRSTLKPEILENHYKFKQLLIVKMFFICQRFYNKLIYYAEAKQ